MKIELESTVTARVVLSEQDLVLLQRGYTVLEATSSTADEKPLFICITKEKTNE
jgi:hypothetical protein